MRANRLKEIWAAGKPVINGWCNMPGAFSAEVMASMGWDAVTIDTQHGLIGYSEMLAMLQGISTSEATPLVRVSRNQPGEIMRALDAGAYGIICPMVNDAAECAAFVQACRYPPEGYRSSGPTRAIVYGGPDYLAKANGEMLALAMVETAQGLANVDAIAATPGLDAIYIGPSDLAFALDMTPRPDNPDPKHMATCDKIRDTAHKHGKKACMHCASGTFAAGAVKRGFDLVMVTADLASMVAGVRKHLDDLKAGA